MSNESVMWPREASKFISEAAKHVTVRRDNIKTLSQLVINGMVNGSFNLADWKKFDINPKVADEHAINWIFVVDSLNFSFWTPSNQKFVITYENVPYTGYFSLCAAVQRALKDGIAMTDPNYYSKMSMEELKLVLRADDEIEMPLLDERLEILHDHGKVLLEKFGGSFLNCVKVAGGSAKALVDLVVENFRSYKDEAIYEGQRVAFYKRAQILVADIWACFEGKEEGHFDDIETLTMFADYRIPQVLNFFKVLEYSPELIQRLQQESLFENQERDEVEIRGCSIWAVELLKDELRQLKESTVCPIPINSITVDFFLWEYRRKHAEIDSTVPYHRVRCIYY
ncbi:hypothetical protein CHUAL_001738 [Chamberlinius hualienensis]